MAGIIVVREGKAVIRIQPTVVGVATIVRFAKFHHVNTSFLSGTDRNWFVKMFVDGVTIVAIFYADKV
jgi:hypothetical protein